MTRQQSGMREGAGRTMNEAGCRERQNSPADDYKNGQAGGSAAGLSVWFNDQHTVSMRITLVLPLSPLVLPPVITTVSPLFSFRASLAARMA